MKIVAYCDDPNCHSGFAQVSRNILMHLHNDGHEVVCLGINARKRMLKGGKLVENEYPFPVIDVMMPSDHPMYNPGDFYGFNQVLDYIAHNEFDIFFTIQDLPILKMLFPPLKEFQTERKFKTIAYFPIDSHVIASDFAEVTKKFDFAVPYTQHAKNVVEKACPDVKLEDPIYHGTNTDNFYLLPDKEIQSLRDEWFPGKFICLSVARNQARKDPCRALETFAIFKKKVPEAVFVFATEENLDYDLNRQMKYYGLRKNVDVFFKTYFQKDGILSLRQLNRLYNMAHVYFTTTLGEGWGLPITEAMSTKTPVVCPDHTSLTEICNNRAYPVACHDVWVVMNGMVDEPPRPITNSEEMAKKMLYVYRGRDKELATVTRAYEWATNLTWENLYNNQWRKIFAKCTPKSGQDTAKS